MFNAQYWKDKEDRKALKEKDDKPDLNRALAFLKGFFNYGKPIIREVNGNRHTRPLSARLIRRQKHAVRMYT